MKLRLFSGSSEYPSLKQKIRDLQYKIHDKDNSIELYMKMKVEKDKLIYEKDATIRKYVKENELLTEKLLACFNENEDCIYKAKVEKRKKENKWQGYDNV